MTGRDKAIGFEVGDSVLVKGKIVEKNEAFYYPLLVETGNTKVWAREDELVTGKTYSDGLYDAWELARKIVLPETKLVMPGIAKKDVGFSDDQLLQIFGTADEREIIGNYNIEVALDAVEKWEKQDEAQPGDVVEIDGEPFAVIAIKGNDALLLTGEGHPVFRPLKNCERTGRKIGMAGILEEISNAGQDM